MKERTEKEGKNAETRRDVREFWNEGKIGSLDLQIAISVR